MKSFYSDHNIIMADFEIPQPRRALGMKIPNKKATKSIALASHNQLIVYNSLN